MKLTVGRKLGLGFASILALALLSGVASVVEIRRMNAIQATLLDIHVPTVIAGRELQRDIYQSANKCRQAILAGSQLARRVDALGRFQRIWGNVDRDLAALTTLAPRWPLQENRDRLVTIGEGTRQFRDLHLQSLEMAAGPQPDAVTRAGNFYADKATPVGDDIATNLAALVAIAEASSQTSKEELASASRSLVWTLSITTLASFCIGAALSIRLSRSFAGATQMILIHAEAIAAGDLTRDDLPVRSQDELGDLTTAINSMRANLKRIILSITENSIRVARASEELSSLTASHAEGADSQKDQTTQVATTMHQMCSTVQQISESSRTAADASHNAAQAARRGGQLVQETLATIRSIADSTGAAAARITELGKSSEQIGKIIAVIDEIADQTNLLALNAAIEAARAGEQGRGFAVVADEVRKLAERTAKATKEIAAMIRSIQLEANNSVQAMQLGSREVEIGVEKTSASGAALEEIIKMSQNVGDMIAQIATAATQQSSATEQINASVAHISSSAQDSSAAAGQTAKACTNLSAMALDLRHIVSQFKLDSAALHPRDRRDDSGPTPGSEAQQLVKRDAYAHHAGR